MKRIQDSGFRGQESALSRLRGRDGVGATSGTRIQNSGFEKVSPHLTSPRKREEEYSQQPATSYHQPSTINHQPHRGFTLVELAVVIAVAALIIGSGIGLYTKTMELENYTTTEEKLLYITEAINNYNDRQKAATGTAAIPCPAPPQLAFSNSSFGASSCTAADGTVTPGNSVYIGGVPTRTLEISPSYAIDAWNRRIKYAMDNDYPAGTLNITVQNYNTTTLNTGAAAVLISHGANGLGAYPGRGSTSKLGTTGTTANETSNYNDSDGTFIQSPRTSTYDDITYYIMKWQLDNTTDRGQ